MAVNPQSSAVPDVRAPKPRAEEATDRPAEDRAAHRTRSVSPGTLDPDVNTPRPPEPVRAEVYRPSIPWALFARLSVLYVVVSLTTTGVVVGGWWVTIGPTDDTPPPPPETIVRVERVEVPVPGPAPEPEVIYVEVPVPAPPPVAPKKRATVVADAQPAKVETKGDDATVVVKVDEPVVPAKIEPKAPDPVTPPAAEALNGAYTGKAGTAACTFDLTFLPDRVVRAAVALDDGSGPKRQTVTGQYDLGKDGSATIALFVGDTAYTAIVRKGELEGRLSQGGKNRGKVSATR